MGRSQHMESEHFGSHAPADSTCACSIWLMWGRSLKAAAGCSPHRQEALMARAQTCPRFYMQSGWREKGLDLSYLTQGSSVSPLRVEGIITAACKQGRNVIPLQSAKHRWSPEQGLNSSYPWALGLPSLATSGTSLSETQRKQQPSTIAQAQGCRCYSGVQAPAPLTNCSGTPTQFLITFLS